MVRDGVLQGSVGFCPASAATSFVTAPESIVLEARAMPARRSGARSAVTRTAAALRRTMSRRGPVSPEKMAVRMRALVRASPPWRVSMGARWRPTSSGVMVERVTMPLWTSANWLGPEMENSSMPLRARPCVAVDYEGVAGVQEEHCVGDERDEVRGVDAHDLSGGPGGVREWADEVEDGADAERAADGHDGLHGRVQGGGVEEGEAMFAEGGCAFFGRESDGDAKGLEDVGGAALRGDGAVAVFGDGGPGGSGDESGGGGDVEGAA